MTPTHPVTVAARPNRRWHGRRSATNARGAAAVATTVALVLTLDQLSKVAATAAGAGHGLLPMRNTALSLELVDTARWVEVAAMSAGVLLAAALLLPHATDRTTQGSLGLLLGGGLSNLADRAALGGVRDFLPLGPIVVNLADIAALVGVLTLTIALGLRSRTRARIGRR